MTEIPPLEPLKKLNRLLFRVAFARERPCYCYGCICLTLDERNYQRRVFRMARSISRQWKAERRAAKSKRA